MNFLKDVSSQTTGNNQAVIVCDEPIVNAQMTSRAIIRLSYGSQPCSTAAILAAISHSISEISQGGGALASVSATTSCLPGTYCTSGLYRIIRINNCWQRMGTLSRSCVFISRTSGLWSVNNLKTPAKHSICNYKSNAQTV